MCERVMRWTHFHHLTCSHTVYVSHIIYRPDNEISTIATHKKYLGWRERNQQDATNLMFIIKRLSQHVSGIFMPITRRKRVCTATYGVLHCLWCLWLCGAGTRAVCTVKVTVRLCTQLASQLHTTTASTTSAEHHMRQCTLLFSWWWA